MEIQNIYHSKKFTLFGIHSKIIRHAGKQDSKNHDEKNQAIKFDFEPIQEN